MRNIILLIFIISFNLNLIAQNVSKTYKVESKTFEIEKKYQVHEITINTDSTYSRTVYKLNGESQKNSYKSFVPFSMENGVYRKAGKFYYFKQSNQDFEMGRYKITEEKIVYFYDWKKRKIRKGATFKRVN